MSRCCEIDTAHRTFRYQLSYWHKARFICNSYSKPLVGENEVGKNGRITCTRRKRNTVYWQCPVPNGQSRTNHTTREPVQGLKEQRKAQSFITANSCPPLYVSRLRKFRCERQQKPMAHLVSNTGGSHAEYYLHWYLYDRQSVDRSTAEPMKTDTVQFGRVGLL